MSRVGFGTGTGWSRGRVFILGDFRFDRLGASYRRAFENLGWDVATCDIADRSAHLGWWLRNRVTHRLTLRSRALRRLGSRDWNDRVRRQAEEIDPDLVLLIVTGSFLTADTVRYLSNRVAPTTIYFPDDPFLATTSHRPEHPGIAREADRCWIWSRRLVRRLRGEWGGGAEYVPFAWDPYVFPSGELAELPEHEVVFIGGWDRWRERWLEPVAEHFDLKIWGPDYWQDRTRSAAVRACWQGRAVRGPEAAKVIRNSAVVLNILRRQNLPDGTNMRTFEVPGAGGFLLSQTTEGAKEVFPRHEAGAYFKTREQLKAKVDHYLSAAEDRREIAARAHRIVQQGHRYEDRVRKMVREAGR